MDLEIKKSGIPNAGKGLFAKALFKRGDRVIEYTGEEITWAQCKKRNEELDGVGAYYFYVSNRKCIDAQHRPDSLARYANDASGIVRIPGIRNNARFEVIKGKPYIIASRNIKPGDEVFVSYGKEYWDAMRENGFDPEHKKKPIKIDGEHHEHHLVPKREAKH
ncbi:MAG: SET domain-containing protein-lysine N-methyltransferase [Bacteroidetes bacterium B1(2017)]|nr:MAG: SET domain-containing protein-lysine N-methyltransferase [Bacteroidetes bacterium B1(2017)]